MAQDAGMSDPSGYPPGPQGDETYVADPNESFIVEHSSQVAADAPRPAPAPTQRCREYLADNDDPYAGGLACPQPDGSWRIVSGPNELIRPGDREEAPRREPSRARDTYVDAPDYADDAPVYEAARPARRFRFDWNAWSSSRRSSSLRSNRNRYDE